MDRVAKVNCNTMSGIIITSTPFLPLHTSKLVTLRTRLVISGEAKSCLERISSSLARTLINFDSS